MEKDSSSKSDDDEGDDEKAKFEAFDSGRRSNKKVHDDLDVANIHDFRSTIAV